MLYMLSCNLKEAEQLQKSEQMNKANMRSTKFRFTGEFVPTVCAGGNSFLLWTLNIGAVSRLSFGLFFILKFFGDFYFYSFLAIPPDLAGHFNRI